MKNRMVVVAGLAVSASAAVALPPVIDGVKDASYGAPQWVNSANPTQFGDNNYTPPAPCPATSGAGVSTGIEFSIPLSAIGNPAGAIKITGFISGGGYDYLSNQVIGPLPPGTTNLAEPRNVNFSTIAFPADEFIVAGASKTPPVIDGQLDAQYGPALFVQNQGTGFGNASTGQVGPCNGSEIDQAFAVVSGDRLYVFVAGNLETNFNKMSFFIDSRPGGQNRLRNDNPDVDFNGLNRMGGDPTGSNGLIFDEDFAADFFVSCTGNGTDLFVNYAELRVDDQTPGSGGFVGSGSYGSDGTLNGSPDIRLTINNSNTGGVDGCIPGSSQRDTANGSEIDALYAQADDQYLYLMVTGNVQTNFNKLVLFFDVAGGGQNTFGAQFQSTVNVNLDADNNFNKMGSRSILQPADPKDPACQVPNPCGEGSTCGCVSIQTPGLTFEPDFSADYALSYGNGNNPVIHFINAMFLRDDGRAEDFFFNSLDFGAFDGGAKSFFTPIPFAGPRLDVQSKDPLLALPNLFAAYGPRTASIDPYDPAAHVEPGLIVADMDNSNLAGVTDSTASAKLAEAVTTGFEIRIKLSELGWDGKSCIKVAGFIASDNYTFMSNQVIGGLPADYGNLGETSAVNFANVPGTQYICLALGGGGFTDCNNNGVDDAQDIKAGASADCFSYAAAPVDGVFVAGGANGVPDECECIADWDRNGVSNSTDVSELINTYFYDQVHGTVYADVDCNGVSNSTDVSNFINVWFSAQAGQLPFAGCQL
jgi:hypothetical protein